METRGGQTAKLGPHFHDAEWPFASVPFQGGAIGLEVDALVFSPFVGSTSTYLLAGGGPILTLGNSDRYLNLGVLSYFVTSNGDGVIIPHAAPIAEQVRERDVAPHGFAEEADAPEGDGNLAEVAAAHVAAVCAGNHTSAPMRMPFDASRENPAACTACSLSAFPS
jgi:hypothetical protein